MPAPMNLPDADEAVPCYRVLRDSPDVAEGYEVLVAPDGSDVLTLTEPEDRTFGRDLRKIPDLLNSLLTRLARAEAERDAMREALDDLLIDALGAYGSEAWPSIQQARLALSRGVAK